MRKFLKLFVVCTLVVCVGLPLAFVAFVTVMAALGITIGIAGALIGLILTVLKFALMIVLPIMLIWWVVRRLFAPERTY